MCPHGGGSTSQSCPPHRWHKLLPNNSYLHLLLYRWWCFIGFTDTQSFIHERRRNLTYTVCAASSSVPSLLELNFLDFHSHSAQNVPSKLIPTSRSDARLLCKTIKGCQGNCSSPYDRQTPHPTPLLEKGDLFFRDLPEENILIGLSYENWQREKDL